jgi:hypothetical protein
LEELGAQKSTQALRSSRISAQGRIWSQEVIPETVPASASLEGFKLKPVFFTPTKTATRKVTIEKQLPKKFKQPPFIPPPTKPFASKVSWSVKPLKSLSSLFSVSVRKGGKWTHVAVLPRKAATQLGVDITEHTAARSFKITPTSLKAEAADIPFVTGLHRYRRPKSRALAGAFVEKTAFAISTPGEKREITLKGIQASSMRLKLKGGRI